MSDTAAAPVETEPDELPSEAPLEPEQPPEPPPIEPEQPPEPPPKPKPEQLYKTDPEKRRDLSQRESLFDFFGKYREEAEITVSLIRLEPKKHKGVKCDGTLQGWTNLDITETTMRFLVPQNEAERADRLDVLEHALSDPEARSQVDSGRMYEPFWYIDSPLTTPDPGRPFPGRPARGQVLPPLPGIIVPDTPITDPTHPEASRLRDIARDGLLVLVADDVVRDDVQAFAAGLTAVPVRTVVLRTLTPDGSLAAILGAEPGEAWVIRPDCHIAAVVLAADRAALAGAICRALALPAPASVS